MKCGLNMNERLVMQGFGVFTLWILSDKMNSYWLTGFRS